MVAFIGAPSQSRLAHQDEASEENRLEGNNRRQRREGARIEVGNASDRRGVDDDPADEDDDVDHHECQAAGECRDRIGHALRLRALGQKLVLVLRDERDVFLDMILRHLQLPYAAPPCSPPRRKYRSLRIASKRDYARVLHWIRATTERRLLAPC